MIHVVQVNVRLLEELKLSLNVNKEVISLDDREVKVLKLLPLAHKSINWIAILLAYRPSAILLNRSVWVQINKFSPVALAAILLYMESLNTVVAHVVFAIIAVKGRPGPHALGAVDLDD